MGTVRIPYTPWTAGMFLSFVVIYCVFFVLNYKVTCDKRISQLEAELKQLENPHSNPYDMIEVNPYC